MIKDEAVFPASIHLFVFVGNYLELTLKRFLVYVMRLLKNRPSLALLDRYFAFIERRSPFDALVFHLAVGLFLLTLLISLITINAHYITTVPTSGGTLVEGIVGTPRFVNPVLAITRADQDMVQLIFSGLLKLDEQGELVPDVAESVEVSSDGRTYTVQLKRGVRFHNGMELNAKDVAFTISLIQNPDLKSPLRGNWDRVIVEVVDDYSLTLTLAEAYVPFKENLTFGILPRELWNELPIEQVPFSQNNTEPIGTGPYQVTNVLRTSSGLISAYQLSSFAGGGTTAPNIGTLVFNFYQNEEQLLTALENKTISGSPSVSSASLSTINTDDYHIIAAPLPRTFGVYFNQNRSVALRDTAARRALSASINRPELISTILYGSGIPTTSPVPPGFLDVELMVHEQTESATEATSPLNEAKAILESGGWIQTDSGTWTKTINDAEVTLGFTLVTANTEVFTATASYLVETWRSLGIAVEISQFEQTDLVQGIIRPRDFEAVLYGSDIGRSLDLFPFWHSSQKSDPGLNIAQYTSIEADTLLEQIRTEADTALRVEAIRELDRTIKAEVPALFLYTPTFNYVLDRSVQQTMQQRISRPSERFANIHSWHVQSDNVWPVFSSQPFK